VFLVLAGTYSKQCGIIVEFSYFVTHLVEPVILELAKPNLATFLPTRKIAISRQTVFHD
jgi:hypothetical protein